MCSKITFPCMVEIAGSWSQNWEHQPCKLNSEGLFEIELNLAPGIYEYKFLLNGAWSLDFTKPTTKDRFGGENNLLIVEKNENICGEKQEILTTIPMETIVEINEDAPGENIENRTQKESKQNEKKTVTFCEDDNVKAEKDDLPSGGSPNFDGYEATSFNTILKQFGRHTNTSIDRKVRNIEEREIEDNFIVDKIEMPVVDKGIHIMRTLSNNVIQATEDMQEGRAGTKYLSSQESSHNLLGKNELKDEKMSDSKEMIYFDNNIECIDNKCKILKSMLTDFLTDFQDNTTEDSSAIEFTEEKEAESLYEVSIIDEVGREDRATDLETFKEDCGFDKSDSDVDNKHLAVKQIIDEFFLSSDDEKDNDSELSESEQFYITESLDEGYKAFQLENFYDISILDNARSESPEDLENTDYNWDLYSELMPEYDSGEDDKEMCSHDVTSEEENEVSDFHEESYAALHAEKMYELLTVKETKFDIPKEIVDEIIDISLLSFQENKINSYLDDVYLHITSKKEKEKSLKQMSYIDGIYEEMKDDKVSEDPANKIDCQNKVKDCFLSYVTDVNDDLKTEDDTSSIVQKKLKSHVDDKNPYDGKNNTEEWVLFEGMESIEDIKEAMEQETCYSVSILDCIDKETPDCYGNMRGHDCTDIFNSAALSSNQYNVDNIQEMAINTTTSEEDFEDEKEIFSNDVTSEEEFDVSDFHEESHAVLQAEKMYELLTVKDITKEAMDEIIDLTKKASEETKINSYIDDIYSDIKSKREKEKSLKLMSYIEDINAEMKDREPANNIDCQNKVKDSFLSYVNDVNDDLKTEDDTSSIVQNKLMSYVDSAYYQNKTKKVHGPKNENETTVKENLYEHIDDVYKQIKTNKEPLSYTPSNWSPSVISYQNLPSMVAHSPGPHISSNTSFLSHQTRLDTSEHHISPVCHNVATYNYPTGISMLTHMGQEKGKIIESLVLQAIQASCLHKRLDSEIKKKDEETIMIEKAKKVEEPGNIKEVKQKKQVEKAEETKVAKEAAMQVAKMRCVQNFMDTKIIKAMEKNDGITALRKTMKDKEGIEDTYKQMNQMKCIHFYMDHKLDRISTEKSDAGKIIRNNSLQLPDLETVVRDMTQTDLLKGEAVSDHIEHCKNPSHRHFGINKSLQPASTSCYNSLKRPYRKGSFIREDIHQVCDSGYNSLKRTAISTQETPPSSMLQMSSKLDHIASSSAPTCSNNTERPATVVNTMVCVHSCLEDKYLTNKKEESGNLSKLTMIAKVDKEPLDIHSSAMVDHEVNGAMNKPASSMLARKLSTSTDMPTSTRLEHEINGSMEKCLSSMIAHEVDRSMDNSLSSIIVHELHRSVDNSLSSMITHEACKNKESMDMSTSAMSEREVNKSIDKFHVTLFDHQVEQSIEKSSSAMFSHMLLQTDQENINISAVGERERRRERSQSKESDTILVDFEDDMEEDDDFCSSDEEWKYETKCDDEKIDYSKHIKTIRKQNKASTRDAMNNEREIMNEIIKKDTENVTELNLELLLLQEEEADKIDGIVEDSVFLTEIPKSENCKEQVETIEVIDIVKEEEENSVRSSLSMKFSDNQHLVSRSIAGGNDITNETQAKLECKSVSQNIVFPWNIKVSNNWEENGKNEEIKIKSDGDIMLDLQNIKPGSYKYKFLINGTTFCDQSLPHKEDFLDRRNVFIIWSNNFPPSRAERVTINAQVTLPWKVQLTGNWPVQPKTIDCQVCTNGDIVARLPALTTGVYEYNFLINNCHFVDESLPFKQAYLTSHNLLVVRDNGEVAWETSQ